MCTDRIKITVIIPTLFKCPDYLNETLTILQSQRCFIHIIDNSPVKGCSIYEGSSNIQVSYYPENIGVNKAWNIGANKAATPYYLLLNDDCLVWNRVIEKCGQILEDAAIGIVTFKTVAAVSRDFYLRLFRDQDRPPLLVDLGPASRIRISRIGWFICGRKRDWVDIPAGLKFFYGDDFIYRMARRRGLRTVLDLGNFIHHLENTTTRTVFTRETYLQTYVRESEAFARIMREYDIENS